MGALEAPQDRHGQEHRTGTSRAEQTTEAMAELGAQEAMAVQGAQEAMAELGALETMVELGPGGHGRARGSGGHGRSSSGPWPQSPRPGPYSRNPITPQKNFHGAVRGYQEPSRAGHTEQDRIALQG